MRSINILSKKNQRETLIKVNNHNRLINISRVLKVYKKRNCIVKSFNEVLLTMCSLTNAMIKYRYRTKAQLLNLKIIHKYVNSSLISPY